MSEYDRHNWVNGELITADKLNSIESRITNIYSNNKLLTALKISDNILLTWENTGDILRVRFYGSEFYYLTDNSHGTVTVSGGLFEWSSATFIYLDFTDNAIKITKDIEELYSNTNYYLFAYMQYLNDVESVTIIGTGSFSNTIKGD